PGIEPSGRAHKGRPASRRLRADLLPNYRGPGSATGHAPQHPRPYRAVRARVDLQDFGSRPAQESVLNRSAGSWLWPLRLYHRANFGSLRTNGAAGKRSDTLRFEPGAYSPGASPLTTTVQI